MINPRKYGNRSFSVAVIHGGPGAGGEMAPVARELAKEHGVLEPLQTAMTLDGQVEELKSILEQHGATPVILIGHSYGAILSFLTAAKNPELVRKLIMVGSAPFEEKYVADIMKVRQSRLTDVENDRLSFLMDAVGNPRGNEDGDVLFAQIGALLATADACDPLPHYDDILYRYDIYEAVWPEVAALRKNGTLLEFGRKIRCPVTAIHGRYDPHPAEGVREPLARTLSQFTFTLLDKCGHTPWLEKQANDTFYRVIREETRES
jgi:pimeloyl-ACP methyl ester carboxylesterase